MYDAFVALTPRDVPVAAALFAVRSLPALLTGRTGLPTRGHEPLLDHFLDLGFVVLAEAPGEEMVLGVVAQMWRAGGRMADVENAEEFMAFSEPGFVKTAMMFRFANRGDGSTLAATEARVLATDAAARRGFRRYWTFVRPFSGLIRQVWLCAVDRRANRSTARTCSLPVGAAGWPHRGHQQHDPDEHRAAGQHPPGVEVRRPRRSADQRHQGHRQRGHADQQGRQIR